MICVAFPTIMSGLVLRWYVDEQGYREHQEIANAGRECFTLFDVGPPELRETVHQLAGSAHNYFTVEYAASYHPRLDVSRWVTHTTKGILSDELIPVVRGAA